MIVDCLSDLHGHFPDLQGGDLLLLAGNYTETGSLKEWATFFSWLKHQKYEKKIIVAGNHDNFLEQTYPRNEKEAEQLKEVVEFLRSEGEQEHPDFTYLCDSGTEFGGYKIWGSPWYPFFPHIHPKFMAFVGTEMHLQRQFKLIPSDTNILITHTPPHGILDVTQKGINGGSISLEDRVFYILHLELHVFGHIRESAGIQERTHGASDKYISVNASHVNEHYHPVNAPIRVIL